MKYCIDCKFRNQLNLCDAPTKDKSILDVVTKIPFGVTQLARNMRENEAYCGAKAVWFEEKT